MARRGHGTRIWRACSSACGLRNRKRRASPPKRLGAQTASATSLSYLLPPRCQRQARANATEMRGAELRHALVGPKFDNLETRSNLSARGPDLDETNWRPHGRPTSTDILSKDTEATPRTRTTRRAAGPPSLPPCARACAWSEAATSTTHLGATRRHFPEAIRGTQKVNNGPLTAIARARVARRALATCGAAFPEASRGPRRRMPRKTSARRVSSRGAWHGLGRPIAVHDWLRAPPLRRRNPHGGDREAVGDLLTTRTRMEMCRRDEMCSTGGQVMLNNAIEMSHKATCGHARQVARPRTNCFHTGTATPGTEPAASP